MNVINLLSESAGSSRSHKTSSALWSLAATYTHIQTYTLTSVYISSNPQYNTNLISQLASFAFAVILTQVRLQTV